MKAYICKYWATQGIFPLEGEEREGGRFMGKWPKGWFQSFSKYEWATGTAEAIEKAKALREKKLRALQKQAQKLIALEIKVKP